MLEAITVKNFILIQDLYLDFQTDFSCFIGETGAGKSILIDAISLLCGAKANKDIVLKGKKQALIEATIWIEEDHPAYFVLKDAGYEPEDHVLIVSRTVTNEGKSISRVNQRTVTLAFLKQFMPLLIDIHSQHDTQYLLNNKTHLALLDRYVQADALHQEVQDAYRAMQQEKKVLQDFLQNEANIDDLDYLKFQLSEMEEAHLSQAEYDELQKKAKRMGSIEKDALVIQDAIQALEHMQIDTLYDVKRELDKIDDEALLETKEAIANAYYSLDEQLEKLKEYGSNMVYDPQEYDAIQERIYDINKLLRKHGGTFASYAKAFEQIQTQIECIENRQAFIDHEEQMIEQKQRTFFNLAEKLSVLRQAKAKDLEAEIQKELQDVYLSHARFKVSFMEDNNKDGKDKVEFLIAMNAGSSFMPLNKVASGGELSRLMLALKTIFTKLAHVDTIIFDEIDNGVSGKVAYAIGEKMHDISSYAQTFAVTHLAPVAAWADQTYLVEKTDDGVSAQTNVYELNDNEVVEQLALMAQGSNQEDALKAARSLVDSTLKQKHLHD